MRKTEYFPLAGGLNLVTPIVSLAPGELIGCQNYEIERNGIGYQRIGGYERYDGRLEPSNAFYSLLSFNQGVSEIKAGDVLKDSFGFVYASALIDAVLESGSYAAGDAAGHLVLINDPTSYEVFPYSPGDGIYVSGALKAYPVGDLKPSGAATDALHQSYLQLATETLRARITPVPGSGPIRGVFQYNGNVYAFRDNSAGDGCDLYRATLSGVLNGWEKITLQSSLWFTIGTAEIAAGDTLTGATSGASATVVAVNLTYSSFTVGDAAGVLALKAVTGTFASGENLQVGGVTKAIANSASVPVALSPRGRYECVIHSFYGSTGALRVYGCDGINPAFEFDGTDFIQIHTGNSRYPTHVGVHQSRLFLGYAQGTVEYSAAGAPLTYSGSADAGEIGVGDTITALVPTRSALVIFSRSQTWQLVGAGTSAWSLDLIADNTGAIEWTLQSLSSPKFFDDRGLASLNATASFGNFDYATFSQKVDPWLQTNKLWVNASCVAKEKNQYRLFFSNNLGLYCTFSGEKVAGFATVLFPHAVQCIWSGENVGWSGTGIGGEVIFFGSDEGWVFQMEKGSSFDGQDIEAFIRTSYYHYRSPQRRKRFFRLTLNANSTGESGVSVLPDFSYGIDEVPAGRRRDITLPAAGGFWGVDNWNEFSWGGASAYNGAIAINGVGENMGIFIRSKSATEISHTLQGITVDYSLRGESR